MKQIVLHFSSKKRLISELLSSRSSVNMDGNGNFTLKGSNAFTTRSNSVFGELETLELAHKTRVSKNNTCEDSSENDYNDKYELNNKLESATTSTCEGQASKKPVGKKFNEIKFESIIFKKPQSIKVNRCKNKVINKAWKPKKKWRKYSLEDIPLSSNATNTSVALAFINELREGKVKQEMHIDTNKLLFSKPLKNESALQSSSKKHFQKDVPTSEKVMNSIKLHHLENE